MVVYQPLEMSPTKNVQEIQPDLFPVFVSSRSQVTRQPSAESIPPPVGKLPNQIRSESALIKAQKAYTSLEYC